MKFSEEVLMAYADGELDAATRSAVEAAMTDDPTIAAEIARHRALRERLRGAFSGVLDEEVPARLIETANAAPANPPGTVVDLTAARATRQNQAARPRWSWPEWSSIAASLLIGIIGGRALLQTESANLVATDSGRLVAAGALASALSTQIGAAADPVGHVNIGLSFRDKGGHYCRTFALAGVSSAGVACREAEQWQILALVEAEDAGGTGEYRQAATSLPPVIAGIVENRMQGAALDAEEEAAARARNWSSDKKNP